MHILLAYKNYGNCMLTDNTFKKDHELKLLT